MKSKKNRKAQSQKQTRVHNPSSISLFKFFNKNDSKNNYKKYVCPGIQRDLVWDEKKARKLFDSINNGLFIGTLLFWHPAKNHLDKLGEISYIPESIDNEGTPALPSKEYLPQKGLTAIIDGQQRISALAIGIHGTWKGKTLCFNGKKFEFRDGYNRENPPHSSFISLDKIIYGNLKKLKRQGIPVEDGHKHFRKQFRNFCIPSYTLPRKSTPDSIIETFQRINKEGTVLTRGQLLLSKISPKWKTGRSNFKSLIKDIKEEGLSLSYEFIVNSYLFCKDKLERREEQECSKSQKKDLMNQDIKNMPNHWEELKSAIAEMAKDVKDAGFSDSTISTYNALVPLVYLYCSPRRKPKLGDIEKYLYISFLKKVFASSSDVVLSNIHKTLAETLDGKKKTLEDVLNSNRFYFGKSDIEDVLQLRKSKLTKIALHFLYDKGTEKFEDDHMHPMATIKNYNKYKEALKCEFDNEDNEEFFNDNGGKKGLRIHLQKKHTWNIIQKQCDQLPNLEPLKRRDNRSKLATPLAEWVTQDEQWKGFDKRKHFLCNKTSLLLSNFEEFFKDRKDNMRKKLGQLINS